MVKVITLNTFIANDTGITPQISGVGLFLRNDNQLGIVSASLAGGTEIIFQGQGMSHSAQNFQVVFSSSTYGVTAVGQAISQDNSFNSNTAYGKLQYSTPSLMSLFGQPYENFDDIPDYVSFDLTLMDQNSETGVLNTLACPGSKSPCRIYMSRTYTPILYYLSPRVIHDGAEVSFVVDPKAAQNYKLIGDIPFVEARINGQTIDFEDFYNEDSTINGWTKNSVRGVAREVKPTLDASVNLKWRVGNSLHDDSQMLSCSIDNSTCYKVKIVPTIKSVSASSGYTSGGQLLTITGYGFDSENIDVMIDGTGCEVISYSQTQFTCKTGANPSASTDTNFVGQNGLLRKYYNETSSISFSTLPTLTPYSQNLALSLEAPVNQRDGPSANVYTGYFKAPLTTRYRFYMSCDDWCNLYLGNGDKDPSTKTLILSQSSYTSWRNYFTVDESRQSDWINLDAGSFYYLEASHIQGTGGDHFTVSVEIETSSPGHQHSMREVQRIMINPVNIREQSILTITNPDAGTFILNIYNPIAQKFFTSSEISAKASANTLRNAIRSFWSDNYGAPIDVTLKFYDANEVEVFTQAESVKNVYTITVNRALSSDSTTMQPIIQKVTTTSTIAFTIPKNAQKSSLPLSGSFQVTCPKGNGNSNQSAEIASSSSTSQIRDAIVTACPRFRDKLEVWDGPAYAYYQDGRDIFIRFASVNSDIDQLEIATGSTKPLIGNDVSVNQSTVINYGGSIVYEPVPFEFLFTAETEPQVLVTVDGQPAVCAGLSCGYTYESPSALITDFSLSSQILTINGENLPTSEEIQSIYYSNVLCTVISVSTSQIECTLSDTVAGTWVPMVTDINGLIPIDDTVSQETVSLVISSISPNAALNPNGETTLTITGENFPTSLTDGSTISITFSDDTECLVKSSSSTQIQCLTEQFVSPSSILTMTITVNGQSGNSNSVTVSTSPATITSITPTNVSPVLKSLVVLQVDPGFAGTLSLSDLSVKLVDKNSTRGIIKLINVVAVDDSAKTITIKYGGAYSGLYDVIVFSETYGKFDSSSVSLQAIGIVTDFQPRSGSVYGGTLITITGYTFSDDYLDNPVKIGTTDCLVEQSSSTEIICRTLARKVESDDIEAFLVFLKTSEEAQCNSCTYTWLDDAALPSLQSYSVAFNADLQDYEITLEGTDFPTSTSDVTFKIDGFSQIITSATNTQIKVQIVKTLSQSTQNIEFYLPTGTPSRADQLTSTGINLTPVLLTVAPSIGSPAGSIITAAIKGLGTSTSSFVTLTTSSGTDICSKVKIIDYGVINCYTKVLTVASTSLKAKVISTSYSCSTCIYSTSSFYPIVATVALQSDKTTILFTGSNFFTSDFDGKATFAGIEASSVTIDSSTQITATWDNGVPLTSTALIPELYFECQSAEYQTHWASITATITNSLSVSSTDADITCSFAGGCSLSITAAGLSTTLSKSGNSLTVCGNPCSFQTDASTSSITNCYVPPLSTIYSNTNYMIKTEDYLQGNLFASNTTSLSTLMDEDNMNGYLDTGSTCYFGTVFTDGHVGILTEVKYFMKQFDRTKFVGKLIFEGSLDGTTYTTVFTVGEEIHEGWNYYDYSSQPLMYRYYRFSGTGAGSCGVGEIRFRGVEAINDNATSYICSVVLNINGQTSVALSGKVTYTSTSTAKLTSISPRYGKVQGGETITFSGSGLSTTFSDYSIKLDGITCNVSSATSTSVKCVTGSRPGLFPDPTIDLKITGKGSIATQGLLFRYVNYWSLTDTWGGEYLPIEDESIYIPKGLHLLVDVDSTPKLNAIVVEGSLIFPPDQSNSDHLRTFDASYMMVKGGYVEVGTEEFPYSSKLIITMHGTKQSPEIPIYGNKCIAVRNGVLDFHGIPRTPTWTELESTALPGATTITLRTSVDWKAGEVIVIAPTGYDNHEAEEMTIVSVNNANPNKPIITLNKALSFKHYAATETYGDEFIDMRAEVGLITRNVIYRGDPETSAKNQYGAHIMLHSHGDESLIGRIEYVEFKDVGQAHQLGRYPLHFHLIGTVHNSYIRGNALHDTYNRAVTIHAVHYLRVIRNVAYNTMGHTFFIEDAIETKNYLEENLAILTKASWSLLNTDQTPASFWITHPDNIFRGNHAAGSDRYGYWFDTKEHPMGPSFTTSICPENSKLGEFTNNVAHSNGKYGLRLFHNLIPRLNPCSPIVYDATYTTDPYYQNPLITAQFINFTSWKNNRNGAIAEKVGDVRFINFKVADNLVAGIEFSLTGETMDGTAQINGALVIGNSNNAEDLTLESTFHGIITARTENFQVHNIKFYNYDNGEQAALGSCSHCFHAAATDSGARTTTFSNIYFDSTVTTRIRYQFPFRDIFYDTDGTLTGLGAKTWATPYWEHNVQPECQVDLEVYDGILCNSNVQVRRLAMYNYQTGIFEGMELKVLKYDDSLLSGINKTEYLLNTTAYSIIPFKPKLDPSNGWAVPYVTKHKYKIHWRYGLDFTQMQMDLSSRWLAADYNLYFIYNFTDVRAKVDVITGGETILNETLTNKSNSLWQTGDNVVYNDTATREIHLLVNGKNASRTSIVMKGYRCVGPCLGETNDTEIEDTVRRWSDPNSWDSKKVPLFNETVEILPGVNMLYDVAESPILQMLTINGRLTFEDDVKDLHLRTKYIFVKTGELIIGNETQPFSKNAKITLYGEKANQHVVFDNAIEAGNKLIINTGKISVYGKLRTWLARLQAEAYPGEKTIKIDTGLDWQAGEWVGLAPSTLRFNDSDSALITSYNSVTGVLVLDRALTAYHWGAPVSTAAAYNGIDMRNEVYLLSRNVKIAGEDIEAWGCQIVTSDYVELSGKVRSANTYLNSVEIYNCSQYDTYKSAIRFEGASNSWSAVENSAIHHGLGYGILISEADNVKLTNNIIFSFVKRGINIVKSGNVTIEYNHVSEIFERIVDSVDMFFEPTGAIISCGDSPGMICTNISIVSNVVSGAVFTGYTVHGHECGDYATAVFRNNIAHSIRDTGAIIFPNPSSSTQSDCMEASKFTAYKVGLDGAIAYAKYKKVVFTNMTFIDNGMGGTPMVGQEGDNLVSNMDNIVMYGSTEAKDCFYENECKDRDHSGCQDRAGMLITYFSNAGKDPMPKSTTQIPYQKIKSDASYGGSAVYTNLQFINFKQAKTWCGSDQRLFRLNGHASDYIARTSLRKVKFDNIGQDAVAYLFTPPAAWANIDDCGNFPCTAPNNALIQLESVTYTGTFKPSKVDKNFQILPNNVETIKGYNLCTKVAEWNGYYCINDNLGVLLFETIDDDKFKRMVTPIYVRNNATNSTNTLNTFMDHIWDGFYTGQLRMSRWPSIIETGQDKFYTIVYSGTPPSSQRFSLRADYSGVAIRIRYPKAGSYIITDFNGNKIKANAWNDTLKTVDVIKRTQCGENRFVGVENILDFYITAGCELMIQPIDAISTKIRLQWTLNEFYADGGTTKFVDRLAASLGIHASTIKVVSVYQGSVIVEFQITPTDITTAALKEKLASQIKSKTLNLGAPILSADIDFVQVIADETTNTNTNTNTNINGGNSNTNINGVKQSTIITSANSNSGSSDSSEQTKLIIIIAVIIGVIIIGAIVGFVIFKKYRKQKLFQTRQPKTIEVQAIDDSSRHQSSAAGPHGDETFEPQYHPKVELGNIYGNGRYIKGKGHDDNLAENGSPDEHQDLSIINMHTNQSNIASSRIESTPLQSSPDKDIQIKRKRTSVRIDNLDIENGLEQ